MSTKTDFFTLKNEDTDAEVVQETGEVPEPGAAAPRPGEMAASPAAGEHEDPEIINPGTTTAKSEDSQGVAAGTDARGDEEDSGAGASASGSNMAAGAGPGAEQSEEAAAGSSSGGDRHLLDMDLLERSLELILLTKSTNFYRTEDVLAGEIEGVTITYDKKTKNINIIGKPDES